jgi:hypothetical protein
MQGYLFSHPIPINQAADLVEAPTLGLATPSDTSL